MWCSCSGARDRDTGYAWPNISGQGDQRVMVHANCRKPSRMVFEKETFMYVPRSATAMLSASGKITGIHEVTYATQAGKVVCLFYHPYPRRSMDPNPGRHLLMELWRKLDAEVDGLKTVNNPHAEYHKNRARAFAEVIADFMSAFYPTANDVVREALVRHDARVAGTEHETPGLAEHLWDPTKNIDGTDRISFSSGPAKKAAAKPAAKLNEQQQIFVRKALADGMKADVLAGMFKVPEADIESLRG